MDITDSRWVMDITDFEARNVEKSANNQEQKSGGTQGIPPPWDIPTSLRLGYPRG